VKKALGRLALLGAAAGAAYALRSYLGGGSAGPKKGDVQIVLDTGAVVEPGPSEAHELADIARKVLEIGG
jgi:hypothetical protein